MALALIAFPLTACGGSVDQVAKAATNSTKKGTVHVDIRGTVSAAGQKLTMNGAGDIATASGEGKLQFTLLNGGKRIKMETVQKGTRIYMRSPLFGSLLPGGKSWAMIDEQTAAKQLGVSLTPYTQEDPTDLIVALKKAKSVKKLGPEVVQGVDTTHYRATVDLSKTRALSSVPIDVWVDQQNLLRRVKTHYNGTVFEIDLSSYGERVNVTVPSASETYDMTKLGG